MNKLKHGSEQVGKNPRDRVHPRFQYMKRAHKDWRVWFAVGLMLICMLIYILTDSESLVPHNTSHQPMPADNAP
jgi:uncharacterized integral membrane protein